MSSARSRRLVKEVPTVPRVQGMVPEPGPWRGPFPDAAQAPEPQPNRGNKKTGALAPACRLLWMLRCSQGPEPLALCTRADEGSVLLSTQDERNEFGACQIQGTDQPRRRGCLVVAAVLGQSDHGGHLTLIKHGPETLA